MANDIVQEGGEPIGASGIVIFDSGIQGGRYVDRDRKTLFRNDSDKWGTYSRLGEYEAILQTSSVARVGFNAINDTIISGNHEIVGDETTPEDVRLFVEKSLFTDMSQDYFSFVREALRFWWFGHMPFEHKWVLVDGQLKIDRFLARLPHSIRGWDVTDGVFTGIRQWALKENKWGEWPIPAKYLTLLVHDQVGDDYRGSAVARQIHPLWWQVQQLATQRVIGHDRNNVGTMMANFNGPPEQFSKPDSDKMAEFLKHNRSHSQGYAEMPAGWEVTYLVNDKWGAQAKEIREDIKALQAEILQALDAGFLSTGIQGAPGSLASSQTQSDPRTIRIQSLAREFESTLNGVGTNDWTGVIKKTVDANFNGYAESGDAYPQLKIGGLRTKNVVEFFDALESYNTAGGVMSRDVHDLARNVLGVDDLTNDEWEEIDKTEDPKPPKPPRKPLDPKPEVEEAEEPEEVEMALRSFGKKFVPGRPLMPHEECVEFGLIEARLDSAVLETEVAVRKVLARHAENLAAAAGQDGLKPLRTAIQAMGDDVAAGVRPIVVELEGAGMDAVDDESRSDDPEGDVAKQQEAVIDDRAAAMAMKFHGTGCIIGSSGGVPILTDGGEGVLNRTMALDLSSEAALRKSLSAKGLSGAEIEAIIDRLKFGEVFIESMQVSMEAAIQDLTTTMIASRAEASAIVEAINRLGSTTITGPAMNMTASSFNLGREAFAEAFHEEIREVRYSAILDGATCGPCAQADAEFGTGGEAMQMGSAEHDAHQTPYADCDSAVASGGNRCRCLLIYLFRRTVPKA